MKTYKLWRAAMGLSVALTGATANAIDIDAGDYTALPEGANVGLLYVQHAERKTLYANDQRVPGNNRLDSDVSILRVVHFAKVGGLTVDPQILLPIGRLQAKDDLAPLGTGSGM